MSPPLYLELLFDIRVPARGPCGDQRRFIADFFSRQLVVRRFLQEKLAHLVVGLPLNVQINERLTREACRVEQGQQEEVD